MNKSEEKFIKMTTAPVEKLVCSLAVPTIISMLISSVYNMADTYFVGHIPGDTGAATAAVSVAFSLMAIIQAFGFFCGHGSGNYLSRQLGKRDYRACDTMAATGFVWAVLGGVLIGGLGLLFRYDLATWLGATPEFREEAVRYLTYILIAAPAMCGSLVINNQLRFQGRAMIGMIGITSGGILNMLLDPLLIYGFGMGVSGAALATGISQTVSLAILLVVSRRGGSIVIRLKNFSPRLCWLCEILRGGTPSLLRQGIASVATVCLNHAAHLVPQTTVVIAALGIVSKLTMFLNSALIGFGQGFQPVCGFNYGAGLYRRVVRAFRFCVCVAAAFLLAAAAGVYAFAPQIAHLFHSDQAIYTFAGETLRWHCLTFPLGAWIIMCNMMQQTMGKAVRASVLAVSRQGLTFIPLILLLPNFLGTFGLQVAQPIADVLTFLISIPLQISVLRELRTDRTPAEVTESN